MRYLPHIVVLVLLAMSTLLSANTFTNQDVKASEHPLLDSSVTFLLRDDITALFDADNRFIGELSQVNAMMAQNSGLNDAEWYLLYLGQAINYQANGQGDLAHQAYEKTTEYEANISENQLALPLFNQRYLLQSELYEQQEQFQLAYDQRDEYFDRMIIYYKGLNKARVEELKLKYRTEIKQNNNELLKNQNELKELQLQELAQRKQQRFYLTIVISLIILVFIVLIVRQVQVRKKLKVYAETDPLTGLSNRKVLFEKGARAVEIAKQEQKPLSVMLFDLDRFKLINDEYGHQTGDDVLKVITKLAQETVRSRDLLIRFGGEEFIAVLPDATIEQAKAMAERLREKLAQYKPKAPLKSNSITASIGVATLKADMTLDQLIHHADIAMYEAKLSGRNQLLIFNSEMQDKSINYRRNN